MLCSLFTGKSSELSREQAWGSRESFPGEQSRSRGPPDTDPSHSQVQPRFPALGLHPTRPAKVRGRGGGGLSLPSSSHAGDCQALCPYLSPKTPGQDAGKAHSYCGPGQKDRPHPGPLCPSLSPAQAPGPPASSGPDGTAVSSWANSYGVPCSVPCSSECWWHDLWGDRLPPPGLTFWRTRGLLTLYQTIWCP